MKTETFAKKTILISLLLSTAGAGFCSSAYAQEAAVAPDLPAPGADPARDGDAAASESGASADSSPGSLALSLSGGVGAMAPVSGGGGLSAALTYEVGHWGFGGFATFAGGSSAAGEPGEDAAPGEPADSALLWGYGVLLSYTGEREGVAPLFGAGIGFGGLSVARGETLDLYEDTGALITTRGGVIWDTGSFLSLNANIPLFSASHREGFDDTEFAFAIIAEYGFRFGG